MDGSGHLAPAPLFDRLAGSPRALGRAGLRASLVRELGRLLNTRSPLPAGRYLAEPLTVLDYGLPDLLAFSPANPDDHRLVEAVVARAVLAFEPRLSEVRVTVRETGGDGRALRLALEAVLSSGTLSEPLRFPLEIRAGRVEIHDPA